MFSIGRPLTHGASVLCCALLATTVSAQGVKPAAARGGARPGVQQMEIFNGGTRTVRYFGRDLSPSEATMLRELERLENESGYVGDLQALKRQYVASERLLETHRSLVQQSLYGREINTSAYGTTYADTGYPFGSGLGYLYRSAGYVGYPPFGYGGFGSGAVAVGGDSVSQRLSLAYGVGPQGPVPQAMAVVLAQQATPEYAERVDRAYDRVAMQASVSPTLRAALRLPTLEEGRKQSDAIKAAGAEGGAYTLTLRSGEKVYANKMTEDKDWYILERVGGGRTKVRQADVSRIDMAAGVVPAAAP